MNNFHDDILNFYGGSKFPLVDEIQPAIDLINYIAQNYVCFSPTDDHGSLTAFNGKLCSIAEIKTKLKDMIE